MVWTVTLVAAPFLLLTAAFVVDTCIRLARNYADARTIGIPIRFIPISPVNPFWVLLDRRVLSVLRYIPFVSGSSFARYNYRGWEVDDRWLSHFQMGDIWCLVTPAKNWIYINDPDTLMQVFKRGGDFDRPKFVNEILDVFGPSIATAEGQSWKTQRRIATRCFNEQSNEIVWAEALTLANDMLGYWSSKPELTSAANDLRTLSLHVLSRAGFGKSFKFQGHDERKRKRQKGDTVVDLSSNYKESLQIVVENLVLILALGKRFIAQPWLPEGIKTVHEALTGFQSYMTGMYEEEKRAFAAGEARDHNLMTGLIRASQDEAETGKEGESGGLTESEIYGNMFAFNFAGHDTVSHTFAFALYFLAANPKVQDWVSEEVQAVVGDRPLDQWNYRADYPRLKRCLSVMYETMRLYTPVPVLKWSPDKAQTINVGERAIHLPAGSMICPSYGAIQTDPRYWGTYSLAWQPSRWIKGTPSSPFDPPPRDPAPAGEEEFRLPRRGAFLGWSEGMRDCPGKKFSQVEFVATLAVLFRSSRVDPVTMPGESMDAARERVADMIKNDSGPVLLLQLLHPERTPLRWRKV